jgi:phosphatidylserine/phosphatidylglycerophosphate/cardiolipin synthase-like enzyme
MKTGVFQRQIIQTFRPVRVGGVAVQVVATMPGEEMAILETHRKAIEQATDYILIEDQYFRAPLLDEVIVDRMDAEPELYLLVVTMPMSEWDPGLKYTYLAWEKLTRLFPERVLFLQLRTWDMVAIEDWVYDDIYFYDQQVNTHSKLRLVDDRYLSVGSCNWNNRGYLYEGELDVAILDEGVASSAGARILDNYVGAEYAGYLTGEMANDIEVLALVVEERVGRISSVFRLQGSVCSRATWTSAWGGMGRWMEWAAESRHILG